MELENTIVIEPSHVSSTVKNTKGSSTAKNGLQEEQNIVDMLNESLSMRESIANLLGGDNVSKAHLEKNGKIKADFHVCGVGSSHKKTKEKQFQQIARHNVSLVVETIPALAPVGDVLKDMCEKDVDGKLKKLNLQNFSQARLDDLVTLMETNKQAIFERFLQGSDGAVDKPQLLSVSVFDKTNVRKQMFFVKMSDVIEFFMKGKVSIRPRCTVIDFGNGFTFQRKGGDGGKPSANQCQFKIVPTFLRAIENKVVVDL